MEAVVVLSIIFWVCMDWEGFCCLFVCLFVYRGKEEG